MLLFLEQRNLCAGSTELHSYIHAGNDVSIQLNELTGNNRNFAASLNLKDETLRALKTFCRGSLMFRNRFDSAKSVVGVPTDGAILSETVDITLRTETALEDLRDLVSNEDVRIDDFRLDLHGLIAELQNRHRSAMALELELILRFFEVQATKDLGGESTAKGGKVVVRNVLNDTLANLNAAVTLLGYRDVLLSFRRAIRELDLLPQCEIDELDSTAALAELCSNFSVVQAPRLLVEVQGSLHGLSCPAITVVGKLLDADVLLLFLKKHHTSFESDLDRAQQRATTNALASSVLMHLSTIKTLLEPFYTHSFSSLADMQIHLDANLRMSADGLHCLTLTVLKSVCDNWSDDMEMHFRDGGDTNSGTEDIQRAVQMYQETGQFISSLAAHAGGSSLSFSYLHRGGTRISLPPELLQTHVQWAVLGGAVPVLEEFVGAFGRAQCAHAIRLVLEEEGHIDHQANAAPAPIAATCQIKDVSDAVDNLTLQLNNWTYNSNLYCNRHPRLLLLNHRSRVNLLMVLREAIVIDSRDRLLSYMIQCFPTLLSERSLVRAALEKSLFVISRSHRKSYDLALAGMLTHLMEINLEAKLTKIDTEEVYEVTRLDLKGSDAVGIYCHHLSDMISQSLSVAQPAMVLWGERTTTERAVRDLLLVASTPGLSAAVHVVGVDRLTPRIREALHRGIDSAVLRSPLLLVFGDRDGVDTFAQYKLENNIDTCKPVDVKLLRPFLWASMVDLGTRKQNAEVYVVAGLSGMGKSHWLGRNILSKSRLHFAVHEGFTVASAIERFKKMLSKSGRNSFAFCFHVYNVGALEQFARFLHHLLSLGLMIDEESGSSFAIPPSIHLRVMIELPEMSSRCRSDDTTAADLPSNWPPLDGTPWNALQHPLLRLLPVLAVVVPPDHYISIRERDVFHITREAQLVATFLMLHSTTDAENFANEIPQDADLVGKKECATILNTELFEKYAVASSRRVRTFLISVLYDRCLYLRRIRQTLYDLEQRPEEHSSLQVRMEGAFRNVFYLFIKEALDIASDAKNVPETSVFTIRPSRVEEFEVIIATHNRNSKEFKSLSAKFMESKELHIGEGPIPPYTRASIAPAFGIENTSDMATTLESMGYLLTQESLVRTLHLHGRRLLGSSVIYEGETGVGKSQNLQLYSALINANNSAFTDMKLHLVALIRAVASGKQGVVDDTVGEEPGVNDATHGLRSIDPSSSLDTVSTY